ncbi:MAG: hypothetical protein JXA37_03560, partial [Chloroflexia bacterium]|nr:hypothetical protein [Chloroflexia bacterium]
QAGKDIVNGLWNGLKEVWESVKRWWDENVGGLIDKAKDLLGISSPSRVFMEIGAAAAEGLAIGVKSVPVPLPAIGQAGGVVDQRSYTSKTVFNVPTGRAWTREDLAEMRRQDEARERAWRR